jgi:hypothetical protein
MEGGGTVATDWLSTHVRHSGMSINCLWSSLWMQAPLCMLD